MGSRFIIVTLVLSSLLAACNSSKNTPSTSGQVMSEKEKTMEQEEDITTSQVMSDKVISLSKGACRGFCKNYNATIHPDMTATFEGKRNVDLIGNFIGSVNKEQYASLITMLDAMPWADYKEDYIDPLIMDLPSRTLTYGDHSVKYHDRDVPEAIQTAVNEIENLVLGMKWVEDESN